MSEPLEGMSAREIQEDVKRIADAMLTAGQQVLGLTDRDRITGDDVARLSGGAAYLLGVLAVTKPSLAKIPGAAVVIAANVLVETVRTGLGLEAQAQAVWAGKQQSAKMN